MPLLFNRVIRVTLVKNIRHLTKNPIVDFPVEGICPQEKSHTAAINAIRHLVDGNGRLLPYLPLPGKEIWDEDPLHAKADNKVLLKQLTTAHHMVLAAASPITCGNPNDV